MLKFNFSFDKTDKVKKFKKLLLNSYKNLSPNKADFIIVAGGDGYMLEVIKKYAKYKKPFYGINCGSFGFLMNNFKTKKLENYISKAKKTEIYPLQVTNYNGKKSKIIAINEVSFFRQSRQTVCIKVKINKKVLVKKIVGDGILISTPAGSTAYNFSAGGPVLSLDSGKLALTPISLFRPRKWKPKIINNNSKIEIINLDARKRPVALVADNVEIRNIKFANIIYNKTIKITLLHDKKRSLDERIKIEQLKSNITK